MRGSLYTTSVILFTALTVLVTGCAPTNVGHVDGHVQSQINMSRVYDQMIEKTITNQKSMNLTSNRLEGAALCNRLENGLPNQQPVHIPTNQLTVVDTRENAFFCQARTRTGNSLKFVARKTAGGTVASSAPPAPDGKGGIGISAQKHESGIVVDGLIPGGPADKTGMLKVGDRIIGVASDKKSGMQSIEGKSLRESLMLIVGDAKTDVTLAVLPKGAVDTTRVTLTRAEPTREQMQAFRQQKQEKAIQKLVIKGNGGEYLSPYTSDGVVAEWVDKAINADMGSATGSAIGSAAGAYAGQKAMESVPGGGLLGSAIGGMLGSDAGGSAGRDAAIEALGGWEYIRSTSDLSFRSLDHMAKWLVLEHGGSQTFANVVNATQAIYPGLEEKLAQHGQ